GVEGELKEERGIDMEYEESGLIKLGGGGEDKEEVLEEEGFVESYEGGVRVVCEDEVSEISEDRVRGGEVGGMDIGRDDEMNGNKYRKGLVKWMIENGVEGYYETEVREVEGKDRGYEVDSDEDGMVRGKEVMVGGGGWSKELVNEGEVDKGVRGVKGEVVVVEDKDVKLERRMFMRNGCYMVGKGKEGLVMGGRSYVNDYWVGVCKEGKDWLL
uniref:FAD-dependent oxidoreductase n=1 Tax=Staphylococcus auricularis TaxID=29379 RepID=UPI001247AA63